MFAPPVAELSVRILDVRRDAACRSVISAAVLFEIYADRYRHGLTGRFVPASPESGHSEPQKMPAMPSSREKNAGCATRYQQQQSAIWQLDYPKRREIEMTAANKTSCQLSLSSGVWQTAARRAFHMRWGAVPLRPHFRLGLQISQHEPCSDKKHFQFGNILSRTVSRQFPQLKSIPVQRQLPSG